MVDGEEHYGRCILLFLLPELFLHPGTSSQ